AVFVGIKQEGGCPLQRCRGVFNLPPPSHRCRDTAGTRAEFVHSVRAGIPTAPCWTRRIRLHLEPQRMSGTSMMTCKAEARPMESRMLVMIVPDVDSSHSPVKLLIHFITR